jgi:hypothetical protein
MRAAGASSTPSPTITAPEPRVGVGLRLATLLDWAERALPEPSGVWADLRPRLNRNAGVLGLSGAEEHWRVAYTTR